MHPRRSSAGRGWSGHEEGLELTRATRERSDTDRAGAAVDGGAAERDDRFLRVERLDKHYGEVQALRGVTLDMPRGSFLVLLGPSGCGKTTTMRSIVGLETPTSGRITVGGRTLYDADQKIDVPIHKRRMGMVFQSYAIWPNRTVSQNVAFPLRVQKRPSAEVERLTMEALELVGLGHLASRGASKLSGGQMQRIALARSIVMRPELLLLDEPLSNLDAQLRDRLRVELKRLQQELGITTVYVTHDQSEALAMADKVAVMFDGVIHQFAAPQDLYTRPATLRVAAFLGRSNFLPGRAAPHGTGSRLVLERGGAALVSDSPPVAGDRGAVARIRVEDVRVTAGPSSCVNDLRGRVTVVTYLGSQTTYFVAVGDGVVLEATVPGAGVPLHGVGDEVHLSFEPGAVNLYEAEDVAVVPGEELS